MTQIKPVVRIIFLVMAFGTIALAEETCLQDAWASFNKRDYRAAISFADKCIDEFKVPADRVQATLEKDGTPKPPVGAVDEFEKSRIFRRGVLNDVATAFFVKGRAAEDISRSGRGSDGERYREIAVTAYKGAIRYPYARTWDPNGWFWSPSGAAAERLEGLEPKSYEH